MANLQTKEKIIGEIKERIGESDLLVFGDLIGLTVAENRKLRQAVRETGSLLKVYKNSLIERALSECEAADSVAGLKTHLSGSTAVGFAKSDPAGLCKAFTEFARGHDDFEVKCGCFNGKMLNAAGVEALGKLGSREEVFAKFVSNLISPIAKLDRAINWPIQSLALTLAAIADKQGGAEA